MIAAHIWNASFPGAAFTQVSAIQATNQTLVTSRSRATRSVKPEATEAAEAAEAATHRHLRLQIYLDGHIQLASRKRRANYAGDTEQPGRGTTPSTAHFCL